MDYKCDFSDWVLTTVFLIRPILDEENNILCNEFLHDQTIVINF